MADYHLKDADDTLWSKFKARAERDGHTLKFVLVKLIERYIKEGLR